MERKVLITGCGGDIGSAIARCYNAEPAFTYPVLGCDVRRFNQGIPLVRRFFEVPEAASADYVGELLRICGEENVGLVVPTTEAEIRALDPERGSFEDAGVELMMNSSEFIGVFSSKSETAAALAELGVCVPGTWVSLPDALTAGCAFPMVVKEDSGCGSDSVWLAHDEAETDRIAGHMDRPVFQEHVGSADGEYTMGVFSDGSSAECMCFRRELGFGGMSTYVEYVEDVRLDRIGAAIAGAYSVRGCFNVQMRKTEAGEYCVFEVNPRVSSTVGFRYLGGFKDCVWWANLLLEGDPRLDYRKPNPFVGVKTVGEATFPCPGEGDRG